jgi:hypothetical protein
MSVCEQLAAMLDGYEVGISGAASKQYWGRLEELGDMRQCICEGLQASASISDWRRFNRYVLAGFRQHDSTMTHILCDVLDHWKTQSAALASVNEEGPYIGDIADLLQDIADPAAVPALERGIYNGPDWDDAQDLARKCIWALNAIGTPDAMEAIRRATLSEDPRIKEFAKETLFSDSIGR